MRKRAIIAVCLALAAPVRGEPPPEGTCPVLGGGDATGEAGESDIGGMALHEGMVLTLADLLALKDLLPEEVWVHREAFFFEGMRMAVGPCHRRYPVPGFQHRATLAHWESVEIDDDGNLRGYVAGVPFPPDRIDPRAEDAGLRWAWNLELRYRGAGPAGSFRLVDMPGRVGGVETYKGSFFLLQTRHRADLAEAGYRLEEGGKNVWVAGGRFDEPFHARHLAWRQMRPERTQTRYREADRTWVYVPDMRKPRRAAATWVDGVFTPRYSSAQQVAAPAAVPTGDGGDFSLKPVDVGGGVSAVASDHIRRGFVGLALRPNAYRWTWKGERDVLALLNSASPGWPENPDRNFGPSGLAMASDRWDVRRAVVLEGALKRPDEDIATVTLYVDYQTHQPLYYIARRANGLLLEVGILVHRFSGDLPHYPTWPSGERALVFDPVGATFFATSGGGTGWRRESYDVLSVPREEGERRRMTSVRELTQGR